MREKMTHFSREIARNARNQVYPFLTKLKLNFTNIWAKFSNKITPTQFRSVKWFKSYNFLSFQNFQYNLCISSKEFFQGIMEDEIKSWKKSWFLICMTLTVCIKAIKVALTGKLLWFWSNWTSKWPEFCSFFSQFLAPHFSREMSRKTISRSREKCEKCAGLIR